MGNKIFYSKLFISSYGDYNQTSQIVMAVLFLIINITLVKGRLVAFIASSLCKFNTKNAKLFKTRKICINYVILCVVTEDKCLFLTNLQRVDYRSHLNQNNIYRFT